MKPQTMMVWNYLKEHGSITPREAEDRLGCMRLAARIAEIKSEGHAIRKEIVTRKNRYGEKVRFARYGLE